MNGEAEKISALVKELRKAKGLTLDEFGKDLDASGQSIWQWENKQHLPNKYDMVRLVLKRNGWVRQFALKVLAVLDPDVWGEFPVLAGGTGQGVRPVHLPQILWTEDNESE